MNTKTNNLIVRMLSGAVYVALMVLSVFYEWVAYALFTFLTITALFEYKNIGEKIIPGFKGSLSFLLSAALCVPVIMRFAAFGNPYSIFAAACLFTLSLFLPSLLMKSERPLESLGLSLFSQAWIVLPLTVLFTLWIPQAPEAVLAFFILIWASDTFAYLGGSLFGKHKLAERISPGKTWEGFAIGTAMTAGLAVALNYVPFFRYAGMELWQWIVFAIIVEVFGLIGDLTESLFKRQAGIKDSGKIIPGHGGVLDRLDSIFLATIPAAIFSFCC